MKSPHNYCSSYRLYPFCKCNACNIHHCIWKCTNVHQCLGGLQNTTYWQVSDVSSTPAVLKVWHEHVALGDYNLKVMGKIHNVCCKQPSLAVKIQTPKHLSSLKLSSLLCCFSVEDNHLKNLHQSASNHFLSAGRLYTESCTFVLHFFPNFWITSLAKA